MLLLAQSVTPSPWGRGDGVGYGLGPGCFLRSLCLVSKSLFIPSSMFLQTFLKKERTNEILF